MSNNTARYTIYQVEIGVEQWYKAFNPEESDAIHIWRSNARQFKYTANGRILRSIDVQKSTVLKMMTN